MKNNTKVWDDIKDSKLDDKNGKLKYRLEQNDFDATNLYSSIRMIYSVRNIRGPHDVPPAELLQAKMSI
ncbi:MAG: hypothetical protein JRN20_23210, partial [Nitrososphaerota archaeon]|nr:hypothetical protein [Nitrososphaerota archaeon]